MHLDIGRILAKVIGDERFNLYLKCACISKQLSSFNPVGAALPSYPGISSCKPLLSLAVSGGKLPFPGPSRACGHKTSYV